MDTVQLLGSAMGLGLMAGIRLYATVFVLGLAIRMGWFSLSPSFSQLEILGHTPVLAVAGVACAAEFLADKVPWFDSIWDSLHTVIRPLGAALLGATALGSVSPTTQMLVALLCGGVAFTGHTSKAATRLVANHSPEPFSNLALSLAEDLMVPAGLWIAFEHPLIAITVVASFLAIFLWLSPKVFRLLHVSWAASRSLLTSTFGRRVHPANVVISDSPAAQHLRALPFQPLPMNYARCLNDGTSAGVHCVASRNVRGLKNSMGYLCATPDGLTFVARRMFRLRSFPIPWSHIQRTSLRRGLFFDSLSIGTTDQEIAFDLFKVKLAEDPPHSAAWHSSELPTSR